MTGSVEAGVLLDDATRPVLRDVIGTLLSACTRAEIAVHHIRLGALDLSAAELSGLDHCRVLLGRLDATALAQLDHGATPASHEALLAFVRSDRVEIRSAGTGSWLPDFSLYRGLRGDAGAGDACLLGAHWFREPSAPGGPSFTCLLRDPFAVARALCRFESLWERSHDIRGPVAAAIERHAGTAAV